MNNLQQKLIEYRWKNHTTYTKISEETGIPVLNLRRLACGMAQGLRKDREEILWNYLCRKDN